MAKRILVALDQSGESESVLPLVADAARGGGATVRLLHVVPIPGNVVDEEGHVVAYADQETARLEAESLDYLRTQELAFDGIPVESTIRFGDPVREILLEAEMFGADLIALTARRRHSLSRLVIGGTTERVCGRTDTAVLVFRPAGALAA